MLNRMKRSAATIAFLGGIALTVFTGLVLLGRITNIPFSPSLLVLGSVILLGSWAVLASELKHFPFWITLAAGTCLVLISLDYWNRSGIGFLKRFSRNEALAFTGLMLIILSRLSAARSTFNTRRYLTATAILTLGSVGIVSALIPSSINEADLSYKEGKDALIALLHPGAEDYVQDIDTYVDDLLEDDSLNPEDREMEIRILNERIQVMQAELALFKATREENAARAREIDALHRQVDAALKQAAEADSRPDGKGDIIVTLNGEELSRVQSFAAAIKPEMPIVRDFAVTLASRTPGSYYRSGSSSYAISREGMTQIIAIHSYISGEWKYVNDPVTFGSDYYSPAHRTIAAGLAGDCDDFAILVSSAIEAVGGKTRILGGSCSGGHHAWAEVYIGNQNNFNEVLNIIHQAFPGRTIEYTTDSAAGYWLCLDWQLGVYSCGNDARVLYQRLGAA